MRMGDLIEISMTAGSLSAVQGPYFFQELVKLQFQRQQRMRMVYQPIMVDAVFQAGAAY